MFSPLNSFKIVIPNSLLRIWERVISKNFTRKVLSINETWPIEISVKYLISFLNAQAGFFSAGYVLTPTLSGLDIVKNVAVEFSTIVASTISYNLTVPKPSLYK